MFRFSPQPMRLKSVLYFKETATNEIVELEKMIAELKAAANAASQQQNTAHEQAAVQKAAPEQDKVDGLLMLYCSCNHEYHFICLLY